MDDFPKERTTIQGRPLTIIRMDHRDQLSVNRSATSQNGASEAPISHLLNSSQHHLLPALASILALNSYIGISQDCSERFRIIVQESIVMGYIPETRTPKGALTSMAEHKILMKCFTRRTETFVYSPDFSTRTVYPGAMEGTASWCCIFLAWHNLRPKNGFSDIA